MGLLEKAGKKKDDDVPKKVATKAKKTCKAGQDCKNCKGEGT